MKWKIETLHYEFNIILQKVFHNSAVLCSMLASPFWAWQCVFALGNVRDGLANFLNKTAEVTEVGHLPFNVKCSQGILSVANCVRVSSVRDGLAKFLNKRPVLLHCCAHESRGQLGWPGIVSLTACLIDEGRAEGASEWQKVPYSSPRRRDTRLRKPAYQSACQCVAALLQWSRTRLGVDWRGASQTWWD